MRPNTLKLALSFLVALLMLSILSYKCHAEDQTPKTGLIVSAKATNYNNYIGTGFVTKVSDDWAIASDAYTGAGTTGVQTQVLSLLKLSPRLYAFAAIGPELTIIQPNPTQSDKLSYFQAATTIGFSHRTSKTISLWIAAERLDGSAPVSTYKLSTGLVIWTSE